MPGIEKLMRGILHFRKYDRKNMMEKFTQKPFAVFFACMDHRVLVTKFTQSEVGDGYVVRNAGNMVPHASNFGYESATTEPGAIELGCLVKGIRNVIVCGHSDCKGMQALYDMRDDTVNKAGSPLQLWLKRHGKFTLDKFKLLTPENSYKGPLEFQGEKKPFLAYIDHDDLYQMHDKLSQVTLAIYDFKKSPILVLIERGKLKHKLQDVNCLQQVENIASYDFIKEKMSQDEIRVHSMWFDIYKGEVHMFSRSKQQFLIVNDENFDHLLQDTAREVEE